MPQSRAYTKGFRDSLVGQSPSCEKNLEIFFETLAFRVLATRFGDLFTSGSSSREGHIETFAAPFATFS